VIRTIGILGGGQLGRMLTLEAKRMGYRVVTLEPFPDSPAGQVADEQIVAAYDDLRAIGELGARSDVVTYEFENIPLASVQALESDRRLVEPSAKVLEIAQNRFLEKEFVNRCGIPTTAYRLVRDQAELENAYSALGFPGILKSQFGGYDGKGQWWVADAAQAHQALAESRGQALVWEKVFPFERELSVIAARGLDGTLVSFPVSENIHDHGVLAMSIVPGRIPEDIAARAKAYAVKIGEQLGIVGTYCVEFFHAGDQLVVNEIAPRVHNSGHYSLDATTISQYEMHVRAICGLPLVEPRLFQPVVMVNILGTGEGDRLAGIDAALADPNLSLHIYGKAHAAARRKMAHFTVLGDTIADAIARAERAREALHWVDDRVTRPAATSGRVGA
jgi:5-(carboxyamino)imidazole ribonucleotide synthase